MASEIETWVANEINRGCDPEMIKSKLAEYGYDTALVDAFLAKRNAANNQMPPIPSEQKPANRMQAVSQAVTSAPLTASANQAQYGFQAAPSAINSSSGPSANAEEFRKMGFFEKVKMIFLDPKMFFGIMPKTGGYGEPLKFALVNWIVSAVFSTIVMYFAFKNISGAFSKIGMPLAGNIFGALSPYYIAIYSVSLIIGSIASLFISGYIIHLGFRMFGGTGTYEATVRTLAYFSALQLFGWIPAIGALIAIYGIYIFAVGNARVQNISAGKVILSVIVISILTAIVLAIIAGVLIGLGLISPLLAAVGLDIRSILLMANG